MLLTLTTTRKPATDLGYLLHKNPSRVQAFKLSFGQAHVFYPEATDERCTAALLLDVDPVALVRGRKGSLPAGFALGQYVSDRPYAASSFLSVAIARIFSSAFAGRSRSRQAVADEPMPLTARVAALPCRGGERLLRSLFEPLGCAVTATRHPLDDHFPAWGESPYFTVELSARCRLRDLLSHLYVLTPVLDDDKHYWVGPAEVENLLRHGEEWLATHPQPEAITFRYLRHDRGLMRAGRSMTYPRTSSACARGDFRPSARWPSGSSPWAVRPRRAPPARPRVRLRRPGPREPAGRPQALARASASTATVSAPQVSGPMNGTRLAPVPL